MTPLEVKLTDVNPREFDGERPQVSLPGVELTTIPLQGNIFNGLDHHRNASQNAFSRMESQDRANYARVNRNYSDFYSNRVIKSTELESSIRENIPSESQVVITNDKVTFHESNARNYGWEIIEKATMPALPLWPVIISKKVDKSKFLSVTKEDGSSVKLNIHDNFKAKDVVDLRTNIAKKLKDILSESKPKHLTSGNEVILKASIFNRELREEEKVIASDNENITLLIPDNENGKVIEITIPIPKNSGLIAIDKYPIFNKKNPNIKRNLNIVGVLLRNINTALEQII